MADLYIRLAKGSFIGGETLYGAIYLNVHHPTAAVGVKLKILGYENYHYSNFLSSDAVERERYFQDTKEYIQCPDIHLYDAQGAIALGHYVFPFQTRLPQDLPASFALASKSGVNWEATVAYFVEASLIGADTIQAKEEFFVIQKPLAGASNEHALGANHETLVPGLFGRLSMAPISVTARIDKSVYEVNETAKLSLSFDVKGSHKPKVLYIDVKVMRDFAIVFRKKTEEDRHSKTKTARESLIGFMQFMCDGVGSSISDPETFVQPEGAPVLLWESHMVENEGAKLTDGLSVLVPMSDTEGCPETFPPSTFGVHIFCMYKISIDIAFKGAKPFTMTVPVPCVRKAYEKFDRKTPPDWTNDCVVISGAHSHKVPQNILDSEVFSRMPSFHIL